MLNSSPTVRFSCFKSIKIAHTGYNEMFLYLVNMFQQLQCENDHYQVIKYLCSVYLNFSELQGLTIQSVSEEVCQCQEYIPQVNLHWYNQTHPHLKFNSYRDNGTRKMSSSCSSTYCNYLTWLVFCTLCKSVLEPIGKASPLEVNVLHKVLGNLRTIFMKLLQVLLVKLMSLCHSDVNQMVNAGVNITETTNSSSF